MQNHANSRKLQNKMQVPLKLPTQASIKYASMFQTNKLPQTLTSMSYYIIAPELKMHNCNEQPRFYLFTDGYEILQVVSLTNVLFSI